MAAVVVLPCAPATTIDGAQRDELGEEVRPGPPGDVRDRRSRRTPPSPSGVSGSGEIAYVDPGRRTAARYGVSFRSQPPTSAPHARASSP